MLYAVLCHTNSAINGIWLYCPNTSPTFSSTKLYTHQNVNLVTPYCVKTSAGAKVIDQYLVTHICFSIFVFIYHIPFQFPIMKYDKLDIMEFSSPQDLIHLDFMKQFQLYVMNFSSKYVPHHLWDCWSASGGCFIVASVTICRRKVNNSHMQLLSTQDTTI